MRVRVLGSAAGGGFPQWNCGCPNCRLFRAGTLNGVARSQAQLAVSADGNSWFLLGASPDIRYQIEGMPELHPRTEGRNSPIAGIVLTCADLDHTLGLLLLREWQRIEIYSTAFVQNVLLEGNSVFKLLQRMPEQAVWMSVGTDETFESGSLRITMIPLAGNPPAYVASSSHPDSTGAISGLIVHASSGRRLAYIPGLPSVSDELLATLRECDVIMIDGTFWTEDELVRVEKHGRLASEIGHLPMSGSDGSLARLESLQSIRRVYIHINNTNPVLDEDSVEHRCVRQRGWEIAYDGMDFEL